jgi:4-aminobutyrate aminotransferase-like enzyme
MAAGLAVLDVLAEEGLQQHALEVGAQLIAMLRPFTERHMLVGDVRGAGLFVGVELVRDRTTLEPADTEAAAVVNALRERGILTGTDGPYHNVLKIRPPMPFDAANATRLAHALDTVLATGCPPGS